VGDGPVVHRSAGQGLGGGVDERAPAVAVPAARRTEGVEEPDELVGRVRPRRLRGGVQLSAPDPVDPVEVRDDEVVLGREVLVEGGLGDARLGDDQVDPDRADAAGVEEAEGRVEDAVARRERGHGLMVDRSVC
jgi:hypothetical protein